MSIDPEIVAGAAATDPSKILDLTGLPDSVAEEIRSLVSTLRGELSRGPSAPKELPMLWAERLQAWVNSHRRRDISLDDGREGLYAGRGE
ncbi:hypothetical protein OJF2_41620 [Aquisphaera giovannonii]|uniref:Uncharacterized protein n=1 Tax=Aquisphaera giovannonii TaxID=406548 RepID=A0A5B9W627_9BACT|nr:hypothetical protein OJF2_41620 [Aquisphaera giovannonii]